MKCRHCSQVLSKTFIDLGTSPPSNAYLTKEKLQGHEKWFPLRVLICEKCWLVQTEDFAEANELFDSDYAYFSSFSDSWLVHSKNYVDEMCERFNIGHQSFVIEVAANDGYLLQYFKQRNVPCLGIEPTASTANEARRKGIEIVEEFFGEELSTKLKKENKSADLMIAKNVLAHVPFINDFVKGFSILLKDNGVATFEFPHLDNLISHSQFDTIYHEHFSYLSFVAVKAICETNGLKIFDVQKIKTHGGSLRVFVQRALTGKKNVSNKVNELLFEEINKGVTTLEYYSCLQKSSLKIRNGLFVFLIDCQQRGKLVVGYGAAAKGNTLINFAGIKSDLLPYVVDRNPAKAYKFLPGSRIPIFDESLIKALRPDFILILPWNLKDEIINQLAYVREWGGKFIIAVPELTQL
jgi:hypothetical protein